MTVECDEKAHDSCISRGAKSVMPPTVTEDENGKFHDIFDYLNTLKTP